MKSKVVYIASPYTSIPDKEVAVRVQIDAGEVLFKHGHVAVLPLLFHYWEQVYRHSWQEWMLFDVALLERCDALLRLPGASFGADMEETHAKAHGIPVFHDMGSLLAWSDGDNE